MTTTVARFSTVDTSSNTLCSPVRVWGRDIPSRWCEHARDPRHTSRPSTATLSWSPCLFANDPSGSVICILPARFSTDSDEVRWSMYPSSCSTTLSPSHRWSTGSVLQFSRVGSDTTPLTPELTPVAPPLSNHPMEVTKSDPLQSEVLEELRHVPSTPPSNSSKHNTLGTLWAWQSPSDKSRRQRSMFPNPPPLAPISFPKPTTFRMAHIPQQSKMKSAKRWLCNSQKCDIVDTNTHAPTAAIYFRLWGAQKSIIRRKGSVDRGQA